MPTAPNESRFVESQPAAIDLSDGEVELLRSLGRELASTRSWWGGTNESREQSVIGVEILSLGRYRVTFRDVVGVVRLPSRQIQVEPKIPFEHFLFIASRSEIVPRAASAHVNVDHGTGFVEVLARWFLDAAEELLRAGLRKDYVSHVEELPEVRGRLHAIETALTVSMGRAVAMCEFDELSDDAPLNRIVLGACQRLARLKPISEYARSRARRVAHRIDGIGPIQLTDMRARVERITSAYARVVPLAHLVLGGCGISSSAGNHVGTAFLVRTPELIEDGLRSLLSCTLRDIGVEKRRLLLGDSGLSMNPDLIFGANIAVGDVKYRYLTRDWNRADLHQVVSFATAFRCHLGLLLGFVRDRTAARPRAVPVGAIRATSLGWDAAQASDPAESAALLGVQVREWLSASAG